MTGNQNPIKTLASKPPVVLAFLSLVTVAMATQLFLKVHRHAVNILFSDQWNLYQLLLVQDPSIWQSFSQQFASHRLGLGIFVTKAVAMATGWNVRAEAFAVAFMLLLIALAAIYLKWRLFKSLTLWDALIPLICLSTPQIAATTLMPFPAYSATPVLLLLLYAICLTLQDVRLRYGILAFLNLLLIFSVWGIFAGFLSPVLLGFLVFRHWAARDFRATRWAGFALAISILSLVLFFIDYRFNPDVSCFRFPHYPLVDYFWFVAHLFSYAVGAFCGIRRQTLTKVIGTLVMLPFVFALLRTLWQLSRKREYEPRHLVIALFISFTFLFALNAAVGRVCIGVCGANAERYQTLLTPAWLGLYFTAATFTKRFSKVAAVVILMFCFVLPQSRSHVYEEIMQKPSLAKRKWKACYLAKEDPVLCDQEAGMSIFHPSPSTEIRDRLDYLKQRRLNLFADK